MHFQKDVGEAMLVLQHVCFCVRIETKNFVQCNAITLTASWQVPMWRNTHEFWLEHHRHAVEIAIFLLDSAQPIRKHISRGLCRIVYTRFDGNTVDPYDDSIRFRCANDVSVPPLDLQLYNNSGSGVGGYHHDPICIDTQRWRSNRNVVQAESKKPSSSHICRSH